MILYLKTGFSLFSFFFRSIYKLVKFAFVVVPVWVLDGLLFLEPIVRVLCQFCQETFLVRQLMDLCM